MRLMKKQLRELEEMVVDAWPAAETQELDGWLLRASGGPSRRGNSVAALESGTELELEERITRAEVWYQERKQRCVFQVGPSAAPKELDQALAARGYDKVSDTMFMSASPRALRSDQVSLCSVRIAAQESDGFREVTQAGRFADAYPNLRGFITRLGSRVSFATAYDDAGEPVAACVGIASEDRLGIYNMLTLPRARRQGAAGSLLRALAKRAEADAVRELYLLVDADNIAARVLYASCGFQDVYGYHYRVRNPQQ